MLGGFGRLGRSLVIQIAYNLYRKQLKQPVDITILDEDAEGKLNDLRFRYQRMDSVIQLNPINIDLANNKTVKDQLIQITKDRHIDEVLICPGNPVLNVQIYLAIREVLTQQSVHYLIRIAHDSGLTDLFIRSVDQNSDNISHPSTVNLFDMFNQTCMHHLLVGTTNELIARQLRENYLEESGIYSSWDVISEEEKDANRAQARRINQILSENDFTLHPLMDWDAAEMVLSDAKVMTMAEMEHELWCDWKRDLGWQYGKEFNGDLKLDPDLVPWAELRDEMKDINLKFIRKLPTVLAEIGIQIHPK